MTSGRRMLVLAVLAHPLSCLPLPSVSISFFSSSLPGTLRFQQQVLLNPVIAISGEEIKAMQQFWGQNICFPTHLSLQLSCRPRILVPIDIPVCTREPYCKAGTVSHWQRR